MTATAAALPALDRFRRCPKQFLLADVERAARSEAPSAVLVTANAVHHALERFFGLPVDARQPENLERALRSVWHQHRRPGAFASRDDEVAAGRSALDMLSAFGERFDLTAEPLAREQWLAARLEGFEVFGKLDRVDRAPGGGLDVIDYKTGRRMLDVGDLRHDSAVQVYVFLAEQAYKLPVERVRLVYLAHGEEVAWEPEREDVAALVERLSATLGAVKLEQSFAAEPGEHCRFCPFALGCRERQQIQLADLVPIENLPF